MKQLLIGVFFLFCCGELKAQNGNFEVKVVSKNYANVRGQLKKVSVEGIGVEDEKGNYIIFRPSEIIRIKVRKRGLTVAEGLGAGTVAGLGIGAAIWSLDEQGNSTKEMIALTAVLTGSGAVSGTITGVVSEIINTKFIFRVKQDAEKYKSGFAKLTPYVNTVVTEHLTARYLFSV